MSVLQYAVVRFVPRLVRDETVNLGVIVVDEDAGVAEGAFLRDIGEKVAALAPGFDAALIDRSVRRLQCRASDAATADGSGATDGRIRSVAQLQVLAATKKNQIQLSEPRPYRAASLKAAAAELYRELVHPVGAPLPEEAHAAS